ncbi:hypothetical protein Tco_0087730 [Tanacetum coccineum]
MTSLSSLSLFPLFVDALSPETSRISGEVPVLLETENKNNAIKVIFEKESDNSHMITSFGAEQVVLVRDEIQKEKFESLKFLQLQLFRALEDWEVSSLQFMKEGLCKELQFSLVDNSKLDDVYLLNRS